MVLKGEEGIHEMQSGGATNSTNLEKTQVM